MGQSELLKKSGPVLQLKNDAGWFRWTVCFLLIAAAICCPALAVSVFAESDLSVESSHSALEDSVVGVYERCSQSVVTIHTHIQGESTSGAGVIIDAAGLILTARHVVGDATSVQVSLPTGSRYSGQVLPALTTQDDLALIQITPAQPLPALSFADSNSVKVGQQVLAIGHPYGFERTLTLGIVSRIDSDQNKIQTDAAINPGNSGGPLLNRNGRLIGINQSIYNPEGGRSNIGIGFAIPANVAERFLAEARLRLPKPVLAKATQSPPVFLKNGWVKTSKEIEGMLSNWPKPYPAAIKDAVYVASPARAISRGEMLIKE